MLLSVFAFGGSWRTFKVFFRLFPDEKKTLAICFLFIPSTFFWTSGLTKEVICMGALGYIFFAFFDLFINKKNIFWNFMTIFFMSYLIINTKIYILIAFIPSIILLITLIVIKNFKSRFIKIFIAPLFFITTIFYLINFYTNSTSLSNRFSSEMILEYAKVSYEYLSQTDLAESTYDLGKFEPTLNGIMRLAPSGINVTLFRPYFWEAKKPIVILASIESTLFLLLTLFVIFKTGIFKIFKLIFSNPIILFCVIFALIFSLAVGLTSGNFGTLMRYKIPMLQFYATALLLIYKRKEYPFSKSIT
jgi:hypothetical protein